METKNCTKCGYDKPLDDFYSQSDRTNGASYCKKCFNQYVGQRWVDTKIRALEYKGSKCFDCGISYPDAPYVIFDFHHLDPSQKDVSWVHLRKRSWGNITKELDKCDLLCSNCHRIRHHNEKL